MYINNIIIHHFTILTNHVEKSVSLIKISRYYVVEKWNGRKRSRKYVYVSKY